jgi:hypothetical protein
VTEGALTGQYLGQELGETDYLGRWPLEGGAVWGDGERRSCLG